MMTDERQDTIRTLLSENGKVVATDLATFFEVSEDTIRRDLRELAKAGHCRRVYGGALPPAPDIGPIATRAEFASNSKARLARRTAELIEPGQTLFIDAGSTNLAVARALPRNKKLTIVTNAPGVALALEDHDKASVILLGGLFNREKGACLGPQTLRESQQIYADLLILGACGLDPIAGITALDSQEAELKRVLFEQSRQLLVAATSDKLGTIAPFRIAAATDLDHLVADEDANADVLAGFVGLGTKVYSVE